MTSFEWFNTIIPKVHSQRWSCWVWWYFL